MIVHMKKASILSLASDRDATLDRLHQLGLLHLQHITEPTGSDIDQVKSERAKTETILYALRMHIPKGATLVTNAEQPAGQIVAQADDLLSRERTLKETLAQLKTVRSQQAPWGEFEPAAIRRLAEKGIRVRLICVPGKNPVTVPSPSTLFPMGRTAEGACFAWVGEGEIPSLAREIPIPEKPLSELDRDIAATSTEWASVSRQLTELSLRSPILIEHMRFLEDKLSFSEARNGMGRAGAIEYLQGYCPADKAEALMAAAKEYGWGIRLADPTPEDNVPTLIKSPAWIRPIRSLFTMLDIVPGYREAETRFAFLIFFSMFFAILVNDAGYGTLFLLLTIALRLRMKTAPAEPFRLFGFLSICAIIWGVLTASYFGIKPDHLPAVLQSLKIPWLTDPENGPRNVMAFCFFVGAIHLTVAHAWKAFMVINSTRALGQLGWICMAWVMYFAARMLILNEDLPGGVTSLFIIALLLIVFFMTPIRHLKKEWSEHVMLPFTVIGCFADLVSYVRLFAVGTASLAVAESFNELAVHNGIHSLKAGLIAVLILVLGHGLNVVLALMSILVHGVRLNTLEFSSHVGLEWTGVKYRPFGNLLASDQE